jgi:sporulation protein YlmC with PRC-barrel domain
MWKDIIAVGILAFALVPAPASARTAPELSAAEAPAPLLGLPVFTSDGVEIGAVTDTGTDEEGHLVLLAEVGRPLGTETVAIPLNLVALGKDRIDLTLTETEVRDILAAAARNKDGEA